MAKQRRATGEAALKRSRRAAPAAAEVVSEAAKLPASPRVAQCTRFMQRRVAEQLPVILEQLLKKSKGDAATLKALWQMSKLDEQQGTAKKRKGSLARELLRSG